MTKPTDITSEKLRELEELHTIPSGGISLYEAYKRQERIAELSPKPLEETE